MLLPKLADHALDSYLYLLLRIALIVLLDAWRSGVPRMNQKAICRPCGLTTGNVQRTVQMVNWIGF